MGSGGVIRKTDKMSGRLSGIIKYHRQRGWEQDPFLEEKRPNQIASFVKPLSDGSRLHRRISRGPKYYTIREHKDSSDPKRSPIGHVVDIVIPIKDRIIRIKRMD